MQAQTTNQADPLQAPKPGLMARFKAMLRKVLQLDDSPESIARGFAIGMLIAMTPTVGLQMIMVAIINTLAKANRAAGMIMIYISNPITMLPIYWFDYQVGRVILDAPPVHRDTFEKIFELQGPNLFAKIQSFITNLAEFSWEVAGPLFLGGFVVGAVLGIITYPVSLSLIRRYRARAVPEIVE